MSLILLQDKEGRKGEREREREGGEGGKERERIHPVAREMAQRLKTLAALTKDPNPVPSTRTRWFTASCNSSSRDPTPSFWTLQKPALKHTRTHTHLYTLVKISILEVHLEFAR